MFYGFRLSFLAFGIGALLALASASSHAQDSVLPAGYESYLSRPDILTLKPKAHLELGNDWSKLRRGHIEAVALLLEMYPDRELYFLARDSELLYDLARWVSRDDPAAAKRLHLLNISRANMRAEHIKDYLAQEGISEATLQAGKKVLFIDTGFSGTIPRVLSEYFPSALRKNLQTHLMSSSNPAHPSTRVFLTAINPAAPGLPPGSLHGSIVSYEHMPRYTDRSTRFVNHQGVWEPISPTDSASDGTVSKSTAIAYMEDLLSYASEKETQELLTKRRNQWRQMKETASADSAEAIKELKKLLESNPQDAFVEAMVRDFVETHQLSNESSPSLLTVESVGLKIVALPSGGQSASLSNKNMLISKYPAWASVLEDPETGIKTLIEKQEFGTLGAITDTITDTEFTRILTKSLGAAKPTAGVRQFIRMLIEKGDGEMLENLALHTFPQSNTADMKDLLKLLIEKGGSKALSSLGYHVFSQPHTADKKDLLRLLIEKGDTSTLRSLAVKTFSQVHTADKKDLLELVVKKGDASVMADLSFVFAEPHTADWGDLLRLVIEKGDTNTLKDLAQRTFSQPHTGDKKELLKLLIEKGDDATMQQLVRHTFSKPHTAAMMKDLLKLVIEKAGGLTLQELAKYTFSKPHSTAAKDLIPLLILRGDDHTRHDLARFVFSQPHAVEMREELNLLIEKGNDMTLRYLALNAFSYPHSVELKPEMRLLIEKGDATTLKNLASAAFSRPHMAGMNHELRLLIEKADSYTLQELAHFTFSMAHTLEMKDELRLVIERADITVLQFLADYTFTQLHWKEAEYQFLRDALRIPNAEARRSFLAKHWPHEWSHPDPSSSGACLSNTLKHLIKQQ